MKRLIVPTIAVPFLVCGLAWAGEITCDNLPAGSLSRIECERNATSLKALPAPGAGILNLGTSPTDPNAPISVNPDTFCGNPYEHQGKKIVLRGLRMKRMLGRGSATFATQGEREILISGLPLNRQLVPDEWYDFTVLPLGISEGRNAYGGPVKTPHALFAEP